MMKRRENGARGILRRDRWTDDQAVTEYSSAADVADAFLDAHKYRAHAGLHLRWYHNEWYRFDGKVFVLIPKEEFKAEIVAYLQRTRARAKAKNGFVGDVLTNLEAVCRMVPPSVTLPAKWTGTACVPQPDCVVVQNGIVDLGRLFKGATKDVLSDHTPSFVSQVCLPFSFDPRAKCPGWRAFLREVLPDRESQQLLQEIFGYCLTFDTSQQKFFIFEGTGANGKGVVLNILTKLLGEANVSSLPLESFNKEHDLVATLGKLVNITSEIGDMHKVAEGLLKQFTGEDLMHFNPKYKSPFSAKATAKLIMSTNVRPPFRDRSDGLWRRLILLPFPVTIPADRRNTDLAEDLGKELSGIFNWSMEGLRSLRKQERFIEPACSQQAREAFKREANPARMFLEECYVADSDGEIGKQDLYDEYTEFCTKGGYKPLNAANFAKEVPRMFPGVNDERPRRQDGSRPRTYRGIASKQKIESQKDNAW